MADSTEQRPAVSAEQPVVRIRPSEGWIALDLPELWQYRELFGFLVWRDVKVKYKQAVLGFAWAVLVPFAQMVIFSLIFGRLAGLPSDGLPRPIFYFAALLPWIYFATALTMSSNSLVGGAAFLTKIYVPRLVIPAAPCFAGLVDFAFAFVILFAIMFYLDVTPALTIFLLLLLNGSAKGESIDFKINLPLRTPVKIESSCRSTNNPRNRCGSWIFASGE